MMFSPSLDYDSLQHRTKNNMSEGHALNWSLNDHAKMSFAKEIDANIWHGLPNHLVDLIPMKMPMQGGLLFAVEW